MKKTKKQLDIGGIIIVLITIILIIVTSLEVMSYVKLSQGYADLRQNHYIFSNIELSTEQNQTEIIQSSEYHSTITTLIAATLLSVAIDVTYFTSRKK